MIIIPAVDIKGGACVQLVGGKPDTAKAYGDPLEVSLRWQLAGAKLLHVIDLDAALGVGDNSDIVALICERLEVPVEFGGGVRDSGSVERFLGLGIDRVILGTFAVEDYVNDFKRLNRLSETFGRDRLLVAVDSRGGEIVARGWQEETGIKTTEFMDKLGDMVWGFLYTDVRVEGRMKGIDLKRTTGVVESTDLPVVVSGGVSSKDDLMLLEEAGAWGVVIGKALYEGKLSFLKD
ncbi:MAG: 1-(5-phosphoribosyl)-5-((5-phosphoribosylamino)methylideneamino)imidazole-4-carboxamide isomerase [Candidatus Altiarchaeales archaeon ex4484_2]|nr:MAG: 1-(5-phosphoribosyl)-5-((5-phosphoribosylamino)methylideneamino)imidazole-4-carboxamide isomerase [Candidatus Altiarchaeales archaeon ex4484_2]